MFNPIRVDIIWDTDRDDAGDTINYVAAIEVYGTAPDGRPIALHYSEEPEMHAVDFWRWLATEHGWTYNSEY